MLTSITVINYQSHRKTVIPLGLFTVVTGPSNSGKSSIIRAGSLAARNASGTDYIRRGAKSCAVLLTGTGPDGTSWAAGIERTAKGGGRYRLKIGDGKPQEFTKLGGKVPDEAAAVLRLGPLNFAGQHDGPYLLTGVSPAETARTLGELTNVSMLFRAAGEAGRVRKGAERDAKGAEARLADLVTQQEAFAGLEGQLAAIEQAEQAVTEVTRLETALGRLRFLTGRLEQAGIVVQRLAKGSAAAAPPDLTQIERGLAKYLRLCDLMCALNQAQVDVEHWGAEATMAAEAQERAHAALHAKLVAAGHCPLCGQGVAA